MIEHWSAQTALAFGIGGTIALAMPAFLWMWHRVASTRQRLTEMRIAFARLHTQAKEKHQDAANYEQALNEERKKRNAAEQALTAATARMEEREAQLADWQSHLKTEWRDTASGLLNSAHQSFLERAQETFRQFEKQARDQGEARAQSLDALLHPLQENLTRYEKGLAAMRADHHQSHGQLTAKLGDLAKASDIVRLEARRLATALQSGAGVSGRWGEEHLRNVVKMAGMSRHVDFLEQDTRQHGLTTKRPDMIINLPNDHQVAIDSKVSLNAYLEAAKTTDPSEQRSFITQHANHVWAHVKNLASKEYMKALQQRPQSGSANTPVSFDFVILFLPGENFYSAALQARPNLFQEAFEKRVLIASPTTLLAILKSMALAWQHETINEQAAHVMSIAHDLFQQLGIATTRMATVGRALESTVIKYNDLVTVMDRKIHPMAEQLVSSDGHSEHTINPKKKPTQITSTVTPISLSH